MLIIYAYRYFFILILLFNCVNPVIGVKFCLKTRLEDWDLDFNLQNQKDVQYNVYMKVDTERPYSGGLLLAFAVA